MTTILTHPGPLIVAGDQHAKHQSWNSSCQKSLGRALRALLVQLGDVILDTLPCPTFFPANQYHFPEVIDFSILRNAPFPVAVNTVIDLSSDHTSITLAIQRSRHNQTATNSSIAQDGLEADPQPR